MNEKLYNLGFYICEIEDTPEEDAKYFYCRYFNNQQYILVSFATEYEYYATLTDHDSFKQSEQLVSMKEKQILG